jgi:hypothetical protein
MSPDFAIRYRYYEQLAYRKWQAQWCEWIGRIMAVYDADCARIESIRKRLRYVR